MSDHCPVALVTGAAQRIGRAIALRLADRGMAVAVHYRNSRGDADRLVQEIAAAGGRAETFRADLSDPLAPDALIAEIGRRLGAPTCLVNNASEFREDSFPALDRAAFDLHHQTNYVAPLFLARAFAAALPSGLSGNIVNILDQRVWRPTPEFFSYSLSKAALWEATRLMAQALAPRIRVNGVGPGPVLQNVHQSPAEFEKERRGTPLERGAMPEEIAQAVAFILDAPAMTGQMIALDGGQHLEWRRA